MKNGYLVVAVAVIGCKPAPAVRAPRIVNAAQVTVKMDESKLDSNGKLASDDDMTVSGIFFRDNHPVELVVHAQVEKLNDKIVRRYPIEIAQVLGATTDVVLDDGVLLSLTMPGVDGQEAGLHFEPDTVQITTMLTPWDEPVRRLTQCVLSRDVFRGGIRFIACGVLPGVSPKQTLWLGSVDDGIPPSDKSGS